jgi:protease-4
MKTIRILLILALLFGLGLAAALFFALREPGIDDHSILKLTLSGTLQEYRTAEGLEEAFGSPRPTLLSLFKTLKQAAQDDRLDGVILKIEPFGMGFAKMEELRGLLAEVRASGKWVWCYTDTFGEFGPSNGAYYLASAADRIVLNPAGELNLIGLHAEVMFLRGTLDKLHVYPDFDHIEEYKTAMNTFTEKAMTGPHREMMEALVNGLFDRMVADIAQARKLDPAALKALIDGGPMGAKRALEAKLVDELAHPEEFEEAVKKKAGGELNIIAAADYPVDAYESGPKIAVVYGMGPIFVGASNTSPFDDSQNMGSATYTKAFKAVRKDDSIKAVVFRVDSPGGSAIASELIRHELVLTRKAKPVVVSMGDVAGSGGYWVSMSADRILASPGTLTGSIGVVVGKFNTRSFWGDLLGVTYDTVKAGANADIYSTLQNFTPEQKATVRRFMEEIYDDFVAKVAEGRKIPVDEVRRIGKGRVYTGAQGLELKLVDRLGGLDAAIEEACKLAKLPDPAKVTLVPYPKKKSFMELVLKKQKGEIRTALDYIQSGAMMPTGTLWCPYRITLQ